MAGGTDGAAGLPGRDPARIGDVREGRRLTDMLDERENSLTGGEDVSEGRGARNG